MTKEIDPNRYYDNYDLNKKYHRILFRPSARIVDPEMSSITEEQMREIGEMLKAVKVSEKSDK